MNIKKIGTRQQVYDGIAEKTKSGLTKDGLIINTRGKIISKLRSELSKANFERNMSSMKQYRSTQ